MGQASSCCNPSTTPHNMQLDISIPNELKLESHPTSIQQFTEPSEQVLHTLQKGMQYLRQKDKRQITTQQSQLWQIKAKTPEHLTTVYCRGGKDNQLLGNVILYFPNKEIFQGAIQNNCPTYGVFVFRKGCYYAGQINNFNAEGKGKFQNNDTGYIYEGSWSKSLPHGHGTQIYTNGDRFEGQMVYGVKFGHGIYSFSNGNIYQGSFYNNKSDGHGIITYHNGNKYEGEWNLGQFNGKGKFIWTNGEIYQGDYFEGKRHGQGKYIFKNGSFYEGSWVNGYQSGEGVLRDKFDEIKGRWEQGQLIN